MEVNKIYNTDCLEGLKTLPDESVNCCVTSPPYFGLRDYGHEGQIGLEKTPELFVAKMVEVFTEVKRVLKKDGTLWLNLGDSYATHGGCKNSKHSHNFRKPEVAEKQGIYRAKPYGKQLGPEFKEKDLIGIPWMVAFALRSSGWYLRQDIIWHKPNPMPESVTDRCTKAHEYIFLFSRSAQYYYDQDSILQNVAESTIKDKRLSDPNYQAPTINVGYPGGTINGNGLLKRKGKTWDERKAEGEPMRHGLNGAAAVGAGNFYSEKANKRSVWTVTTKPFSEAHFATFPEDLIVDCIKAGCPENGLVLDPFMGAGTTALVASKLNRNFIGFELNADYIKIAKKRLQDELGMFNPLHKAV